MHMILVVSTVSFLFIYHIIGSVFRFLMPKSLRKKKDIAGQKILITGAGNGLGRHLAVEFSKFSTCLVLLDIDEEALRQTSQLTQSGSRVLTYKCDVSNRKMVYAVAEKIKDEVGDIDIVVNNAGIVSGKSLIDIPDEKILKTMEVNAIAHFWICKSFLPSMMAKNSGHIVTVASVAGCVGSPKLTDYCASKYAAVGFAESLELELRSKNLDGIKITLVCPGHINTELFDGMKVGFGKVVSVEDAAKIIVEGVLEEKEFVCFPSYWSAILFFHSIFPRWLNIRFYADTNCLSVMENFQGKAATQSSFLSSVRTQSTTNGVRHRS